MPRSELQIHDGGGVKLLGDAFSASDHFLPRFCTAQESDRLNCSDRHQNGHTCSKMAHQALRLAFAAATDGLPSTGRVIPRRSSGEAGGR